MEKKRIDIIVTELMLVKAGDWDRTFVGTIKREIDDRGNPVIRGEVIITEGRIWSMAANQNQLCRNLDELCLLKLDCGLHASDGIYWGDGFVKYFLN
jgi:hypothetical protein